MSYRTRRELLIHIIPRYREAENKEKQSILNEFIASSCYSRKYAICLPPELGLLQRVYERCGVVGLPLVATNGVW